jgi:hypothetical protein
MYLGEMAELDELIAALDGVRSGVLKKLAGVSEADARRSTVDSGTNLAGLLQHLTFAEALWFEERVGGGKASRGLRTMTVDPSVSLSALRADYRAACDTSNAIIREIGDPDAPIARDGKTRTLRSVILGVLHEIARHAGHADIIREQIDGMAVPAIVLSEEGAQGNDYFQPYVPAPGTLGAR